MIEAVAADAAPVAADAGSGPTAGAMLRAAREAAGLHVAAMAVALKVPVGKLEALEHDRYDLLPDAVFARALASTVCRSLKVDPRPILERLPQTSAPRLIQDTDGINAPFRSPRDQVASSWRDQLTRPVSLAVGALLLGAAAVMLWPHAPIGDNTAAAKVEGAATPPTQPIAPATEQPAKSETAAAAPRVEPPSASPMVPASITVPAPAPTGAAAPRTVPAAVAAAPSPAAPAAATPDATSVAFVRVSAPSWIEVRDARGAVPLRKVLAAGDSANISGAMPLQVTVGNVDATELDVRGKRFDLKAIARDNVARFQIQ